MFSGSKLFVFVAIAVALWLAFRLIGTMDRRQKMQERMARPTWRERFRRAAGRSGPMRAREAGRENVAEVDMVPCRACGAYVAARGARACGRADCPYPPAA